MSIKLCTAGGGILAAAPLALIVFMAINAFAGNTLGYTAGMYLIAATIGLAFGNSRNLTGRSNSVDTDAPGSAYARRSFRRSTGPTATVGGVA